MSAQGAGMELKADYGAFVRYGLVIIGLAGLLFAAGDAAIPQEGAMFSPTERPEDFAALVTSDAFLFWAVRGLVGVHMELIGTIALFFGLAGTSYERWAFWGMLLCALADLFSTGLFTLTTFVFPAVGEAIQAGQLSAGSIASLDAFMPIMGAGYLVTALGLGLFAVAIWKTDRFPRWAGVLALVGWLLIPIQGYAIQIAANLLWGGAYLWMAASPHRHDQP